MRFTLRTSVITVFTLSITSLSLLAQTPSPCGVVAGSASMYGGMPKVNSPFSITVQTTHEQKLADGNVIHGLVVTHEYRDAAGRVRDEISMGCNLGLDGNLQPSSNISVYDPTTKTTMSWQVNAVGQKVVRVRHQQDPQPPPVAQSPTEEQRKRSALVRERWLKNTRSENLGTRTIAGVLADGSRQITTTPAGEQGNEQPMESMAEVWIARDTGLAMLRIDESPQAGRTTTEVMEMNPGDPDPSVFAPPPGYRVEEQVTTTKPVALAAD